jgi:hypothetical protein
MDAETMQPVDIAALAAKPICLSGEAAFNTDRLLYAVGHNLGAVRFNLSFRSMQVAIAY